MFAKVKSSNGSKLTKQLQVSHAANYCFQEGVPALLVKNQERWTLNLVKHKKFQLLFSEFAERIHKILEDELNTSNTQLVNDYLKLPLDQSPVKVPLSKYDDLHGIKTNLQKARLYINELQTENKKKEAQLSQKKKAEQMTKEIIKDLQENYFAIARARPLQIEKEKKPYLHPLAEDVKQRIKNTNELLKTLDQQAKDFNMQVNWTDAEIQELKSKQQPNPGDKICNMMNKWGEEPILSNKQIDEMAMTLWKSKEQFEKELRDEDITNGWIVKQTKAICDKRIQKLREHASFRILALESALNQVKIKCQQEVERTNMRLQEIESTLLNIEKSDAQIAQDMTYVNGLLTKGLDFESQKGQQDIVSLIKTMKGCINALQQTILSQIQESKKHESDKIEAQKNLELFSHQLIESGELTQLYMQQVWSIVDKSGCFGSQSVINLETRENFQKIGELNQEISKIKMKGAVFYAQNLMPMLYEIDDLSNNIQMTQTINLYIQNQNDRILMVNELLAIEEESLKNNKGAQNFQFLSPSQKKTEAMKQQLISKLKKHPTEFVSENLQTEQDQHENRTTTAKVLKSQESAQYLGQPQKKQSGVQSLGGVSNQYKRQDINSRRQSLKQNLSSSRVSQEHHREQSQDSSVRNFQNNETQYGQLLNKKQKSKEKKGSKPKKPKQNIGKNEINQAKDSKMIKSRPLSDRSSSLRGFEIVNELDTSIDLKADHSLSYESDDTNLVKDNSRSQNKSKTQQKANKKDKFEEKGKSAIVEALKAKVLNALKKTELATIQDDGKRLYPENQRRAKEIETSLIQRQPNKSKISGIHKEVERIDQKINETHQINRTLSINSLQDVEEIQELKEVHEQLNQTQALQLLQKYKKFMQDKNSLKNNSEIDQDKLTSQEVKELIEVFQQTSQNQITHEDQVCLQKTLVFQDFFKEINRVQSQINNSLKNSDSHIGVMRDAITATTDAFGALHKFTLVPDVVRIVYLKENKKLDRVKQLIRTVVKLNENLNQGIFWNNPESDSKIHIQQCDNVNEANLRNINLTTQQNNGNSVWVKSPSNQLQSNTKKQLSLSNQKETFQNQHQSNSNENQNSFVKTGQQVGQNKSILLSPQQLLSSSKTQNQQNNQDVLKKLNLIKNKFKSEKFDQNNKIPGYKEKFLSQVLKDHLILIAQTTNPLKLDYYDQKWKQLSIDELLSKQIGKQFDENATIRTLTNSENEQEHDAINNSEENEDLTCLDYLQIIFEQIDKFILKAQFEMPNFDIGNVIEVISSIGFENNRKNNSSLLAFENNQIMNTQAQISTEKKASILNKTNNNWRIDLQHKEKIKSDSKPINTMLTSESIQKIVQMRLQSQIENTVDTMDQFIDEFRKEHSNRYKKEPISVKKRFEQDVEEDSGTSSPAERSLERINYNIKAEMNSTVNIPPASSRRNSDPSHVKLPQVTMPNIKTRSQSIATVDDTVHTNQSSSNKLIERPFRTLPKNQWEQLSQVTYRFPVGSQLPIPSSQSSIGLQNDVSMSEFLASGKTLAQQQFELDREKKRYGDEASHQNLLKIKSPRAFNQGLSTGPIIQSGPFLLRHHDVTGILRRTNDKVDQILSRSPPQNLKL